MFTVCSRGVYNFMGISWWHNCPSVSVIMNSSLTETPFGSVMCYIKTIIIITLISFSFIGEIYFRLVARNGPAVEESEASGSF